MKRKATSEEGPASSTRSRNLKKPCTDQTVRRSSRNRKIVATFGERTHHPKKKTPAAKTSDNDDDDAIDDDESEVASDEDDRKVSSDDDVTDGTDREDETQGFPAESSIYDACESAGASAERQLAKVT
jgi:hypothetical protein